MNHDIYMTDDGPIVIREDMPKEQMWFILNKLLEEQCALRSTIDSRDEALGFVSLPARA